MTLGVYGLVSPAPRRIGLTGIAGERLRVVTVGAVSAIVGDLARAPRPTETSLRKYDGVMHALARRSPALLPVRFGTGCDDVDELSLVLASRQQSLVRLLRHVRNRAQITIRLAAPDPCLLPVSGTAKSGSAYLRERVAAAARAREIPGFDPVRAAVRRWVKDERIERQAAVASVYHLIPRGSVAAYRGALDRATRTAGLRVRVSGPWPPYAFATSF